MRILLVEPDEATGQTFETWCRTEVITPYRTDLGEEAIDLGKLYDYDAIVLDLNLPDMSGYEVIRTLRVAKVPTQIIVCSGLAGVEDIVRAYGFGADAYLTKPVHKDVFISTIHAVVRRSKGVHTNIVQIGKMTVDIGTKRVFADGKEILLTAKEYAIVELLTLRQGMVCTKDSFLNHLYGGRDEPELKIIDVFICKVRHKLKAFGCDDLIQTVWGRGYTIDTRRQDAPVNPSELTAQEIVA